MKVNTVAAGYPDPAMLGRKEDAGQLSTAGPQKVSESTAAAAKVPAAELSAVLSQYDVHEISPTKFSEMLQKLFEVGAISQQELQTLALVRQDLDNAGIEPDEAIDLLDFYLSQIEKTDRRRDDSEADTAGSQQFGPLLKRLDWIEKFALIQSSPGTVGLDALA